MKYKNILIIGAPRSGTTLLSGILTGNEECFPNLPECTIITQEIEQYYKIMNYLDKERFKVYAKDENTLKNVYKEHINNMLTIVLDQFNSKEYKFLILKDPILTLYIDLIEEFFVDNKVVYIIRDPREIISSMLKVELKKLTQKGESLPFFQESMTKKIAEEIYNYFHIVHQSKRYNRGDVWVVRYENLIHGEEDEFLKLENFIGYKLSRKAFERNFFDFDTSDPTFSLNYNKDIVKVESEFKKILSKKSLKMIQAMFTGFNAQYNWW